MKRGLVCLLAIIVTACAKDPPPVTIVAPKPRPLVVAPECDPANDPRWTNLPDADVRRSEAVRVLDHDGDAFDELADRRHICWASLEVQMSPVSGAPSTTPSTKRAP